MFPPLPGEALPVGGDILPDSSGCLKALADTREKLYLLSEALPHCVWVLCKNGELEYINGQTRLLTGCTLEALNAMGWSSIVHPDDLQSLRACMLDAFARNASYEIECRLRTADGSYRWVSNRAVPVLDAHGETGKWVGTSTDIHDRRLAEEARAHTEARLRLAQKAGFTGSFDWNIASGEVGWSDELCAVYGLPAGGFGGRLEDWWPLLHPNDCAQADVAIRQAFVNGDYSAEFRIFRADDGAERWLLARGEVHYDAAGQPVRMIGINVDITERKKAELALDQSRARLKRMLDGSSDGYWEWDVLAEEVFISPRGCEIIGLPPDTPVHHMQRVRALMHPEDRERILQTIEPVLSGRSGTDHYVIEYRYVRPDGESVWVHGHTTVTDRGPDGQATMVCGILSDISQRKQGDQALEESEARFRALADAMPHLVWTAQPDGTVDYYNARYREFAGIGQAREGAWEWAPVVHEEDLEATVAAWQRAVSTGTPYQCEHRVRRADGSYRWYLSLGVPARDEQGRIVKWYGSATDLQAQKAAEAALRASEKRLRLALGVSGLGVFEWNLRTQTGLWKNARIVEIFGLTPDAPFLTLDAFFNQYLLPEDRPVLETALANARHSRQLLYATVRIRRGDGMLRWVELAGQFQPDSAGEPVVLLGVLGDITERKETEDTLRENDRRKDEFLATLAHELRNPLSPIRNALQVLRMKTPEDETVRWGQDVIDRQVSHLTRLIDDLLDVSRITRNRIELRKERIALAEVVRSAVESSQPLIDREGHHLEIQLPAAPLYVEGDFVRLTQVVLNLINNAAKYTPPHGQIRVSAEREGSQIVLSVADNGIGLTADDLAHIFDMFYQAEAGRNRAQSGLGIGLTLVRQLVEKHGGQICAQSPGPGLGSCFRITLPALPPDPSESPSANVVLGSGTARRRILVVDDNHDAAESLTMLLELSGHEVEMAHDGAAAVEAVERFGPEVVFMDLGMPVLNGYEAAEQIRRLPLPRQPWLVALTGWGQEEHLRRAREAGFNAHLTKPVEYEQLARLLAEWHPSSPPVR